MNEPATSVTYTLSLHDALPISTARTARPASTPASSFQLSRRLAMTASPPAETATEPPSPFFKGKGRSEEHTSELQSLRHLVCRLLLEKKKKKEKEEERQKTD